jgi:hypothetical protein
MNAQRIRMRVAAVAIALLLAYPTASQAPDPGTGLVESVHGKQVMQRSGSQLRSLRKKDRVVAGAEILTGKDSRATIRRADGSKVEIYPDSRVVFRDPSSGVAEFLHLFLGRVKLHIEKLSGRPNDHQMTTPTALIAVRGTRFSVRVDENETTSVAVEEGVVSVRNPTVPDGEILLRRGERSRVQRGIAPEAPQRFRGASEREGVGFGSGQGVNRGMGPGIPPMGGAGGFGAPGGGGAGRGRRRP